MQDRLLAAGLTLRKATTKDGPAVYDLVERVLDEYAIKGEKCGTDRCLADIDANYFARGGIFEVIVDRANTIKGAYGLYPLDKKRCELRKMYFDASIRGKGIGRGLLVHAIEQARSLGFSRVELETASALKEARGLYAAFGFRQFRKPHLPPRCDEAWFLDL